MVNTTETSGTEDAEHDRVLDVILQDPVKKITLLRRLGLTASGGNSTEGDGESENQNSCTSELQALDLRFRVFRPEGGSFRLETLTKKR